MVIKKQACIQTNIRQEMLDMFRKFSDEDLMRMYNILHDLDIQGFALSFCIEILEERGFNIDYVPKSIHAKS